MGVVADAQVSRFSSRCSGSRPGRLLASCLTVVVLASCATAAPDDDPYQIRYEEALRAATSDFERAVLEDGEITRAEYEEAVERYVSCMADAGVEVGLHEQGGYYTYSAAAASGFDATHDRCAEGTTLLVAGLYVDQLTNPGAEDYDELIVACLIRAGLVDPDYTAEQLTADATDQTLPLDDSSAGFHGCMANPTRDLAAR